MPQWGPFLATIAVLTVLVLLLARASAAAIRDGEVIVGGQGSAEASYENAEQATDSGAQSRGRIEWEQRDRQYPNVSVGNGEQPDADSLPASAIEEPPEQQSPDAVDKPQVTTAMLLANVVATQGLVVVSIVVAAWYFAIPVTAFGIASGPMSAGLLGVLVGLGFGIVLWIGNELSTTLADAVGAAYDETVREMLAPETPAGWVVLLTVVLPLIALAEELLFRAALIGVPAAGYGIDPWLLAVVSSVAFALGHGAQGRVGIVVTGALGFVLAGGYILTGSLLVVVVAHYVINAMEFVVHEYYM